MESNSISLFSKNLNNFKQKSVQNWFYNNDNINYFNQRENSNFSFYSLIFPFTVLFFFLQFQIFFIIFLFNNFI